jgi:predicted AAA+ superfamily ATPase
VNRYLTPYAKNDLSEKMVFIGGPRQVGKTTLSLQFLPSGNEKHPAYLNWDSPLIRKDLLAGQLPPDQQLIILDEIHKYKDWKSLIKGFYDLNKSDTQFLVTGSARLDYFRKGGDSLQGRYHYYRLHPLTLDEISPDCSASQVPNLLRFGGFPEPQIKSSETHWKRWERERAKRVIFEDLVSLENVRNVSQVELLASLLPHRIGSLLSINNLSTDLQVAFETTEKWVSMLENLYVCFRISPWTNSSLRSLKKEKKVYMWDWSVCADESARYENMVASHLFKFCHLWEDARGEEMTLQFIRNAQGKEIDFVVVKNQKPWFAVECKTDDRQLSKQISYYAERTNIPKFFQVHLGSKDYEVKENRARVLPFHKFCEWLQANLPKI